MVQYTYNDFRKAFLTEPLLARSILLMEVGKPGSLTSQFGDAGSKGGCGRFLRFMMQALQLSNKDDFQPDTFSEEGLERAVLRPWSNDLVDEAANVRQVWSDKKDKIRGAKEKILATMAGGK